MNTTKINPAFAWLVCSLGAIFYCYEYLLRILPSIIADDIMATFHISATALGSLAAIYYLAYVPMQLPAGILVDKYGPKKILIMAALICATGSFLFTCGNLPLAELGRFLIGLGSAFAFISALKLAAIWLPESQFALAVGLIMALSMLGVVGGDIVLGKLVALLGWPMVSYFLAFVGLLIAGAIALIMRNKKPISEDDAPATLVGSFKQQLQYLIELLKMPQLWLIGLAGCLLYLPISLFAELWAIPFLSRTYAFNNMLATKISSMMFLGMAIGSPCIGFISDYLKKRISIMLMTAALSLLSALLILYCLDNTLPRYYFYLLFFMFGVFCSGQTLVFPLAREFASSITAGTAMAMVNMLVMIGGMLFQPFIGHLLDRLAVHGIKGSLIVYSAQDFHYALFTLPLGILIGLITLLYLKEPKKLKTS